ncbi:MAG: winged helix-turn-helix domain-containing protein [Promethearchaeota archaeon]
MKLKDYIGKPYYLNSIDVFNWSPSILMTNSEAAPHQTKYQDIVNFKPEVLRVIDNKETLKILLDPNYENILMILRKKPMTAQEITAEYNKIAETCYRTEPKTDKTIYRYLKTLEKHGLAIPVGQRVILGKTATEKLYMRTARIFQRKDIDWTTTKGNQWAQRFASILSYMLNTNPQEASIEGIQEFFRIWNENKFATLKKFAKTESEEILELIIEGEWEELLQFIDWVYIFGTLLNQPNLLEELYSCFKKSSLLAK